jgi:hypothetical protein
LKSWETGEELIDLTIDVIEISSDSKKENIDTESNEYKNNKKDLGFFEVPIPK